MRDEDFSISYHPPKGENWKIEYNNSFAMEYPPDFKFLSGSFIASKNMSIVRKPSLVMHDMDNLRQLCENVHMDGISEIRKLVFFQGNNEPIISGGGWTYLGAKYCNTFNPCSKNSSKRKPLCAIDYSLNVFETCECGALTKRSHKHLKRHLDQNTEGNESKGSDSLPVIKFGLSSFKRKNPNDGRPADCSIPIVIDVPSSLKKRKKKNQSYNFTNGFIESYDFLTQCTDRTCIFAHEMRNSDTLNKYKKNSFKSSFRHFKFVDFRKLILPVYFGFVMPHSSSIGLNDEKCIAERLLSLMKFVKGCSPSSYSLTFIKWECELKSSRYYYSHFVKKCLKAHHPFFKRETVCINILRFLSTDTEEDWFLYGFLASLQELFYVKLMNYEETFIGSDLFLTLKIFFPNFNLILNLSFPRNSKLGKAFLINTTIPFESPSWRTNCCPSTVKKCLAFSFDRHNVSSWRTVGSGSSYDLSTKKIWFNPLLKEYILYPVPENAELFRINPYYSNINSCNEEENKEGFIKKMNLIEVVGIPFKCPVSDMICPNLRFFNNDKRLTRSPFGEKIERENIDGVEFLSFESEKDMRDYTSLEISKFGSTINGPLLCTSNDSSSANIIIPTKTKDITKIKGWRTKVFSSDKSFSPAKNPNFNFVYFHPSVFNFGAPLFEKTSKTSTNLEEQLKIIYREKTKCDTHLSNLVSISEQQLGKPSVFESENLDIYMAKHCNLKISFRVPALDSSLSFKHVIEQDVKHIRYDAMPSTSKKNLRPKELYGGSIKPYKPKTLAEKRSLLECNTTINEISLKVKTNTQQKSEKHGKASPSIPKFIWVRGRPIAVAGTKPLRKRRFGLNSTTNEGPDILNLRLPKPLQKTVTKSVSGNSPAFYKKCKKDIKISEDNICKNSTFNNTPLQTIKVTCQDGAVCNDVPEPNKINYRRRSRVSISLLPKTGIVADEFERRFERKDEISYCRSSNIVSGVGMLLNIGYKRPLPQWAFDNLNAITKSELIIDKRWANIAASALFLAKSPTVTRIMIPIAKPLMETLKCNSVVQEPSICELEGKVSSFCFPEKQPDEIQEDVSKVIEDMVEYVVKKNEEPVHYPYDPDVPFLLQKALPKRKKLKLDRTERELRKLINVTILDHERRCDDANFKGFKKGCSNLYCLKGCICSSLNGKVQCLHCGNIECIFGCKCPDKDTYSENQSVVMNSDINLAKEELTWRQTVIWKGNKDVEVMVGNDRTKREKKLPTRYRNNVVLGKELSYFEHPRSLYRKMCSDGSSSDDEGASPKKLEKKRQRCVECSCKETFCDHVSDEDPKPKLIKVDDFCPSDSYLERTKQRHESESLQTCRLLQCCTENDLEGGSLTLGDVFIWCTSHNRYHCLCVGNVLSLKSNKLFWRPVKGNRYLTKRQMSTMLLSNCYSKEVQAHTFDPEVHCSRTFGAAICYLSRNKSAPFKAKRVYEVSKNMLSITNGFIKTKNCVCLPFDNENFVDSSPSNCDPQPHLTPPNCNFLPNNMSTVSNSHEVIEVSNDDSDVDVCVDTSVCSNTSDTPYNKKKNKRKQDFKAKCTPSSFLPQPFLEPPALFRENNNLTDTILLGPSSNVPSNPSILIDNLTPVSEGSSKSAKSCTSLENAVPAIIRSILPEVSTSHRDVLGDNCSSSSKGSLKSDTHVFSTKGSVLDKSSSPSVGSFHPQKSPCKSMSKLGKTKITKKETSHEKVAMSNGCSQAKQNAGNKSCLLVSKPGSIARRSSLSEKATESGDQEPSKKRPSGRKGHASSNIDWNFTHGLLCLTPGVGFLPVTEFTTTRLTVRDPKHPQMFHSFKSLLSANKWLHEFFKTHYILEPVDLKLSWVIVKPGILQRSMPLNNDFLQQPNIVIRKDGVVNRVSPPDLHRATANTGFKTKPDLKCKIPENKENSKPATNKRTQPNIASCSEQHSKKVKLDAVEKVPAGSSIEDPISIEDEELLSMIEEVTDEKSSCEDSLSAHEGSGISASPECVNGSKQKIRYSLEAEPTSYCGGPSKSSDTSLKRKGHQPVKPSHSTHKASTNQPKRAAAYPDSGTKKVAEVKPATFLSLANVAFDETVFPASADLDPSTVGDKFTQIETVKQEQSVKIVEGKLFHVNSSSLRKSVPSQLTGSSKMSTAQPAKREPHRKISCKPTSILKPNTTKLMSVTQNSSVLCKKSVDRPVVKSKSGNMISILKKNNLHLGNACKSDFKCSLNSEDQIDKYQNIKGEVNVDLFKCIFEKKTKMGEGSKLLGSNIQFAPHFRPVKF